jgi:hypothetical protein
MTRTVDGGRPAVPVSEQSTAELVKHATEQASRLVRDEIALARAELSEKGKHAGIGAGLFGGGGVIALYGFGVLLIAAVLGLAEALPTWLAALIVGGALLVIAGILALVGRSQVNQAGPPMPEGAARSMRADMDTVTTAMRGRGRS